jgi:ATP-dependent helicase/nuclease subunit B
MPVMVDTYYNIAPLLPALSSNQLILTANNRLRNHLLRAYVQYREREGSDSILTPRVYTLQQWFDQQWQTLQGLGWVQAYQAITTPLQREWLWQDIIQGSSLATGLLQAAPLAQAADLALRSLELWQLDEDAIRAAEPMMSTLSNSHSFLVWLGEFRTRLVQLELITQEQAFNTLIKAFHQQVISKEALIWLLGFDDIPPLHQDLINTGCERLETIHTQANTQVDLQRTQCNNSDAEMLAAALWSREQLLRNPGAMIGIIVPNLGQCRDQVERAFTQVFEPLASLPDQPRFTLPFNFSAGTPLASCPLIAATLDLLQLHQSEWPLEDICQLLLSPFWGAINDELVIRTYLVEALQQLGRFTISASDVRYQVQKISSRLASPAADAFSNRLLHLEAQRRPSFGNHPSRYWSDFFAQLLQSVDWPGQRRLDSQEHQQLALWNQVLDTFNQLDSCNPTLSYTKAQQQLRNIASKMPFQAQTPLSPIQILGALEGAGLEFSHCWVMGLHHRQWPPAPAPNPLLPIYLQRQYKMPHANAERELLFARSLTQHYRQCAPQVVFSSATTDNSQELSPSALIRDIPLTAITSLLEQPQSDADAYLQDIVSSTNLEVITDAQGPAIDLAIEKIHGGASIFKEQAACPFNAFAKLRLGAKQPDAPVAGFSAIERGNMLHDALARLWRTLKNQQQLLASTPETLAALIQTAVKESVTPVKNRRGHSISHYYAELEEERLANLLSEWLEQEKQRPPFEVIAIEESLNVQFTGLDLKLRIDRIDQLDNGDLVLIDYKTGNPNIKSWLSDKPEEPQLPLYALVGTSAPAAIAFAQINAKTMKWIGTGALEITHPGINTHPDWQQQLNEWQQILTNLAQDFIAGDARLDFNDKKAQDYAEELLPLNRFLEADAVQQYSMLVNNNDSH